MLRSHPPDAARIPELVAASPRALERVLHGVLGVVLLACQAPRERQQLRQFTLDPRLQYPLAVCAVVGGCPGPVSHYVLRVGTSHKMEVAQMSFGSFMSSSAGRGLRIVAGGALIVAGVAIGGSGGTIIAIVGVVPLAAERSTSACSTAVRPALHGPQARGGLSPTGATVKKIATCVAGDVAESSRDDVQMAGEELSLLVVHVVGKGS